jgi:hypothetical protein
VATIIHAALAFISEGSRHVEPAAWETR